MINPELRELYQQIILDHNKNPKNFGALEEHTHSAEGFNPLCGDHLYIDMKVVDNVIQEIAFRGGGCAISKSSASLMTEFLKGRSIEEARHFFQRFHDMVTGGLNNDEQYDDLDKLEVLQGVREFPVRIKCATLSWHTLIAALDKDNQPISTE